MFGGLRLTALEALARRALRARSGLRFRELCSEVEESFEVVGERHQRPFGTHFLKPAQAELPESHRCFYDAEYGLDGLFALLVKCPSSFGRQPVLHDFFGARSGAGRGWVVAFFQPFDAASVRVSPGRGVDGGGARFVGLLLGLGDCCFAVKSAVHEHVRDCFDDGADGFQASG